ncbi:MAG TPA: ABC transporter permease [Nitrolancea sp.]|nr:ABC transporter permease [Nitrolancea sp.]
MTAYIIRRVLMLIPIWFGILVLTFLMRVLVPGDPIQLMFAGRFNDPAVEATMRHKYGLDKPILTQFYDYTTGVLHGNLGYSITAQQPVTTMIKAHYPYTVVLTLTSLSIAVTIGLVSGIISAIKKDTIVDVISMIFALAGLSMPAFWLGLLMIYVFAVDLRWFPVLGSMTPKGIILPSVTLGVIASAVTARLVRSTMLDVLGEDYVRTARAKGITSFAVVLRHAFRNALIPIVTIVGLQFGGLLSGAFIVEVIFAWHGIGELAITALQQRDFPLIQGIVLVVATTYVLVNLVVDLLYAVLDPRIAYK